MGRRLEPAGGPITEVAIVGLGSWGLTVLERMVSRARTTGVEARIHVVEPSTPGGGVYGAGQPDYLILNNPCGQLSLYAAPDGSGTTEYGLGLFEWAVARGYRWVGYELRIDPAGLPIEATDYLPRRVMGEYLTWFYSTLVASAPENIQIVAHPASAVDIVTESGGRERVVLDDDSSVLVDHVIITSGHTQNGERENEPGLRYSRPYPVEYFDQTVSPGAPVAIAGMGLVGYDLVTSLTVGRGGTYIDLGTRLRYVRSGQEPMIYLYSRSGKPYLAKSAHGIDPTGDYKPIVCTPAFFASLQTNSRSKIDFRRDVLPLLFVEMQCRFLSHAAYLKGGDRAAQEIAVTLRERWEEGQLEKALEELEPIYGSFHPEQHTFELDRHQYASSRDYEEQIYKLIETDLDHALDPHGSPLKAALEITRILRDQLRSVIEFGGLSLESYADFQANIRGEMHRIEAGPPALRSQQILALIDAGVVRFASGPMPKVSATPDGRIVIHSTRFDRPHTTTVSHIVRGHLDQPSLASTASPLLRHLYVKGRLTQLTYGDTPVGSVAINEDFHPYDAEGRLQRGLSLLGVLTEGVRYFTFYLPSPRSRIRAVMDAQSIAQSILG